MTGGALVQWIIASSLSGSAVILALIALRLLSAGRLPARWLVILWILPVFKLLFPMSVTDILFPPISGLSSGAALVHLPAVKDFFSSHMVDPVQTGDVILQSSFPFLNRFLAPLFLAGVLFHLSAACIINLRLAPLLRATRPVEDEIIIDIAKECARSMLIKRMPRLRYHAAVNTPLLYGIVNPQIILPENCAGKSAQSLRLILLHELHHLKSGDNLLLLGGTLFRIIFWFNPLVLLSLRLFRQDIELSCDERVLSQLTQTQRRDYAMEILRFAGDGAAVLSGASASFSAYSGVKKRIINIVRFNTKPVSVLGPLSVMLLVFGTAFTGGAASAAVSLIPECVAAADFSAYTGRYEGSILLYDPQRRSYEAYNIHEASKRGAPYSTFKIYLALLALEQNIIAPDEIVVWDGREYPYKEWEHDQTLSSAMRYSVNWYFERIAALSPGDKTDRFLKELHYGSVRRSSHRDFWSDGSLQISLFEQVDLLSRLAAGELAFAQKNCASVLESIRLVRDDEYSFYGKTGSGAFGELSSEGLFTGYVERDGQRFFVAVRIMAPRGATGLEAKRIACELLYDRGILPRKAAF